MNHTSLPIVLFRIQPILHITITMCVIIQSVLKVKLKVTVVVLWPVTCEIEMDHELHKALCH